MKAELLNSGRLKHTVDGTILGGDSTSGGEAGESEDSSVLHFVGIRGFPKKTIKLRTFGSS